MIYKKFKRKFKIVIFDSFLTLIRTLISDDRDSNHRHTKLKNL